MSHCFCSEVSSVINGQCNICKNYHFDPLLPTALLPGRFQPWHSGHLALFEKALGEVGQVSILVKCPPRDSRNPFTFYEVSDFINAALGAYKGRYNIIQAPNITQIVYGRDFGIQLNHIELDEATKGISATIIRAALREEGFESARYSAIKKYKKTFKTGEYKNLNSAKYYG